MKISPCKFILHICTGYSPEKGSGSFDREDEVVSNLLQPASFLLSIDCREGLYLGQMPTRTQDSSICATNSDNFKYSWVTYGLPH